VLKLSVSAISAPLVTIFNESFRSCCFPQIWKNAIVTPMFKRGDIFNMANYWPISILPIISKVIEKLVAMQLCF
jgi:hypothetical protein